VQNHLGHINKTHLRELLKDKEHCEGMIKYVNLNSHESYHIIENLLSQSHWRWFYNIVNFSDCKLVSFKLQKNPTSGKEMCHMNL